MYLLSVHNIAVDDSRIKQVWKEYFERLLNEEFEWNKDLLEMYRPTIDYAYPSLYLVLHGLCDNNVTEMTF